MLCWLMAAAVAGEPETLTVEARTRYAPNMTTLPGTYVMVPSGPATPYTDMVARDERGNRIHAPEFAQLVGATETYDEIASYRADGRARSRALMLAGGALWVLGGATAISGFAAENDDQLLAGVGVVFAGQAAFAIGGVQRAVRISRSKKMERWFAYSEAQALAEAYNAGR